MKPITDEDIVKARADLIAAGNTEDEADAVLIPFINEINAKRSGLSTGTKQVMGVGDRTEEMDAGLRNAAALTLPMLGGTLVGGLGARAAASADVATAAQNIGNPILRFVAKRGIEQLQPMGEMAGIAGGDALGRLVTGQPQDPAASLGMGATGAGVGTLFRLGTRGVGAVGNVPSIAVREAGIPTAGILPSYQKVVRPLPRTIGEARAGISSESILSERAAKAVEKMKEATTEPRQMKLKLLAEAEAAGARIDPLPVIYKIKESIPNIKMEPSTKGAFSQYLDDFANNMIDESVARGGTFSPLEWDEFVRTNLKHKAFTSSGDEAMSRIGPIMREIKDVAAKQLRTALPADKQSLDAQISAILDQADEAERLFSGDSGNVINRIRNIRKPGNEDSLKALNFLSKKADKGLAGAVMNVGTRRMFTTDIREPFAPAGGHFGMTVKSPLEFLSQVAAPLQSHAGPVAAPFLAPAAASGVRSIMDSIKELLAPKEESK